MYYMLGCFGPLDADRVGIGEVVNTDLDWQTGRRFEAPPPNPVLVDLNPDYPGVMVPMFDAGILLFSKDMVAALKASGVDNLDTYPALIRDLVTGSSYEYLAVNIIGAIACADLGASRFDAPSGSPIVDTDFDSLVIDEARTKGAMMFRLAECITGIVVHERVRQGLEKAGIPYLDFTEPANWVG